MNASCILGHTQRAMECPACGEAATGATASLEHWKWYRGRTTSKRIKALIDQLLAGAVDSYPNPVSRATEREDMPAREGAGS